MQTSGNFSCNACQTTAQLACITAEVICWSICLMRFCNVQLFGFPVNSMKGNIEQLWVLLSRRVVGLNCSLLINNLVLWWYDYVTLSNLIDFFHCIMHICIIINFIAALDIIVHYGIPYHCKISSIRFNDIYLYWMGNNPCYQFRSNLIASKRSIQILSKWIRCSQFL